MHGICHRKPSRICVHREHTGSICETRFTCRPNAGRPQWKWRLPAQLAGRDALQQLVDRPVHEAGRGRGRIVLAARQDGAGEQEHRDLDIDAWPELAGLDAAAQHGADQFAPGLNDFFLVPGDEPGVPLPRAVQQRVLLREARVVGVGGDHGEQDDEVLADRLAARLGQRVLHRGERGDEQVLLAGPAAVERRLADPGPSRDVLAAHAVDAALAERLDGRLDDRLLGPLAARPPRAARGVRAFRRARGGPAWSARARGDRAWSARVLDVAPGARGWCRLPAVAGGRHDADVRRRHGPGGQRHGAWVPGDRLVVRFLADAGVMSAHDVEPPSVRTQLVLDFDLDWWWITVPTARDAPAGCPPRAHARRPPPRR